MHESYPLLWLLLVVVPRLDFGNWLRAVNISLKSLGRIHQLVSHEFQMDNSPNPKYTHHNSYHPNAQLPDHAIKARIPNILPYYCIWETSLIHFQPSVLKVRFSDSILFGPIAATAQIHIKISIRQSKIIFISDFFHCTHGSEDDVSVFYAVVGQMFLFSVLSCLIRLL